MSSEEVWADIERSYRLQREFNQKVLDDNLAALSATSLMFSNQLLVAGLLTPQLSATSSKESTIAANPQ
jgi:hypothetical protein